MGWTHRSDGKARILYAVLVQKHHRKRSLGRTGRRWEDNTEMDLRVGTWMEWLTNVSIGKLGVSCSTARGLAVKVVTNVTQKPSEWKASLLRSHLWSLLYRGNCQSKWWSRCLQSARCCEVTTPSRCLVSQFEVFLNLAFHFNPF
jgi:hypothetical protein